MWIVEELGFPLAHDLKLVALQGDCALEVKVEADGGTYVVKDVGRARQACLTLIEHARAENVHLALIPELAIPQQVVAVLIEAIKSSTKPLIFIGGIEGISPAEYRALVATHGGTPDLPEGGAGTYVNAMLVAIRTATNLKIYLRAKRFASGPENRGGPQLALGAGPFLVLKLGSAPFVIVPLICSEFTWPELWTKLKEDAAGLPIDLIPVLQRNQDIERRYTGPVMHAAYQNNLQTRFVLANQALLTCSSDGTCFVVTPPVTPAAPGFDHGRHELWLPNTATYKGFRIPERTGCFWYAEITHPAGQGNAARPPVCHGRVLAVLTPSNTDLSGLPAGLMRSAAADRYFVKCEATWAKTEPKKSYRSSLVTGDTYILNGASRSTANGAFVQMICDARPTWETVERLVDEFIDTGAMLACGGDQVRLTPCPGGNCTVSGRPVAVLYAPDVDAALEARFSTEELLSGATLPTGIVLVGMEASSRIPRAKTVGDVLRADRVSSESPELSDGPARVPASSVTISLGNIYFCEPGNLRRSLDETTLADARNRSAEFLPGVYL
jgi:hypothetical protein